MNLNLEAYFFMGMAVGAGMWLAPLVLTVVLSTLGAALGVVAALAAHFWKRMTK